MQSDNAREMILREKLIAIIRGVRTAHIVATAQALCRSGIVLAEVTLDHTTEATRDEALQSISLLAKELGGSMLVGAGTVLTAEQARRAIEAGARYIVSPDTNPDVIRQAKALGALSLPGAFTPTEVAAARAAGADFVKLFPAGALGSEYIRAIRAPLSHIPLIAVGGVDVGNIAAFLRAGVVGFGIGSNLVDKRLVKEGRFGEIESLGRSFVRAVRDASSAEEATS
jgi:2-dehydro-3-deoxyphosphogluconate aldolase/(4S)-4-hydroxy-2-oxoglutarate aldolase